MNIILYKKETTIQELQCISSLNAHWIHSLTNFRNKKIKLLFYVLNCLQLPRIANHKKLKITENSVSIRHKKFAADLSSSLCFTLTNFKVMIWLGVLSNFED